MALGELLVGAAFIIAGVTGIESGEPGKGIVGFVVALYGLAIIVF